MNHVDRCGFGYDTGCAGYMIPDVPSKYTKRGGTTSARKPSLLWDYMTSTSTATTKVLTSTALTPGSALAGLGEASPVNLLLSLLIITLTVVVIFGVVIGVVFVVRRRRTNNPTPRLTVADSQRRSM